MVIFAYLFSDTVICSYVHGHILNQYFSDNFYLIFRFQLSEGNEQVKSEVHVDSDNRSSVHPGTEPVILNTATDFLFIIQQCFMVTSLLYASCHTYFQTNINVHFFHNNGTN